MANRPFFLIYDIPTEPVFDERTGAPRIRFSTNGHMEIVTRPVIANPSDELWEAGCVRINLSCWLTMERNLHNVYPVMNRMSQFQVRWHCVPFDISAKDDLRRMALDNIKREISERLESARATRLEADTRLDDESETDHAKRRRQYVATARSIDRRVNDMICRVRFAATEFEITATDLRSDEAASEVELLTSGMRAKADAFADAYGIARRAGKDAEARSLRRGEMPPTFFADFLDETVDTPEATDAATRLRSSFSDFFDE